LDDLIDFMVRFANEHAFSLQELAARIRERLLAKPGDQLLIVEPEKEIGNLMPEENRRVVGQAPPACTVSQPATRSGCLCSAMTRSCNTK